MVMIMNGKIMLIGEKVKLTKAEALYSVEELQGMVTELDSELLNLNQE